MAKIVVVCYRDPQRARHAEAAAKLKAFLDSLCPDNLAPRDALVAADDRGLYFGMFNPAEPGMVHGCSGYTGWLHDSRDDWWRTGAAVPNGSYALVRSDEDRVEALADAAASRTLWVAFTQELFVASSSIRAIPFFLGSFAVNPTALSWMLSCGSLGPSAGWDRRAHPLGPDGSARLDRHRWQLDVRQSPVVYEPDPVDDQVHAERLRTALMEVCGDLRVDPAKWVLPLSGGYDSRALLLLMQNRQGVRTVTWGRAGAVRERGSDAYIAPRVAKALGVQHGYFPVDLSDEPFERLLWRYLVAGDGRTDGFAAYMDGFATWKSMAEAGVVGIIRGDHGFGPGKGADPQTESQVLQFNSMARWSDYQGVPSFAELGMPEFQQTLPESHSWRCDETAVDWRDRMYLQYRVPSYVAAQSDLKAPYVEIASPLFARSLLQVTCSLPRHLRQAKRLFRESVAPYDVPVPYAVDSALTPPKAFLAAPAVREYLCDELSSARLRNLFSAAFADYLLGFWSRPAEDRSTALSLFWRTPRRYLKMWVPKEWRVAMRGKPKARAFDGRWITFRACIASRMSERLESDGIAGQRT